MLDGRPNNRDSESVFVRFRLDPGTVADVRFLAIFGLVAIAEMATFFWVESRIGLPAALGLAAATAIIGSVLVRRAGISVVTRIQERTRQGQLPGRELSDGAAILVAGAFLISPGFITDLLGFLLLVPAVRSLVYRQVSSRLAARVTVFGQGPVTRDPGWIDTTGEIIDIDPEDVD